MGVDLAESRRERSVEMRDQDDPPVRERWGGGYDDMEENVSDELRESGKYRSKDKSKSSGRKEDKEHRSRDREKSKSEILKETEKESKGLEKERISSRDRRKEDRDERGKDKVREKDADRDKHKEKERDKDRKDRGNEREREREKVLEKDGERGRDKERIKDKSRENDKDRERTKEREREKEREKYKDRERERENDRDVSKEFVEREKGKERIREKEKQADQDKERARGRDRSSRKHKDESHDRSKDFEKDDSSRLETNYSRDKHITQQGMNYFDDGNSKFLKKQNAEAEADGSLQPASELEDRISKMKEERLKKKSEGGSEVLSWVDKSRKLEDKRNAEKEKALQLSKIFEEQDNINEGESDDEVAPQHNVEYLGGVKILHGIDKVLEGGAVVLTLKDQSILADGDINQEIDMLENVEMGEQKRRNEAYKAAKKKTGIYDDKFNDEPGAEKKILPQYDDPVADEGITLDASGHFTGEAEKKLEELRKRLQGVSASNHVEDLNSTGKISTDYYTQEEMLKFKKPKKKKSLRKKEKLDLDSLEAEAISAGLGTEDLGSRNDGRRQNLREEQEKSEAEMRRNAYQSAYARADEASKALRLGQTHTMKPEEEDDAPVFDDDEEELRKSLERARRLAFKKQDEKENFGPREIPQLATSSGNDSTADNQNSESGEPQENKVVFTEMEEFVWGLQLDEEAQKPATADVFMDEDVAPSTFDQDKNVEGGWTEVEETMKDEIPAEEEEVVPDETIHESAVGKGLAGALKLLKDRGTLKETVEWGGRNMDKKKSKLVGIYDEDKAKEILIERTDEYGRILTPKEAFRLLSHKFHGKGPGKMKQEKRIRQYQEELKIKQMKNADTPLHSVERMREAQAQLKTPYLVLSGHVKPGQTSDPRSGFATVEKDFTGGLTPMLGDKKVEHFLNMKRKYEPEDSVSHKKPKT